MKIKRTSTNSLFSAISGKNKFTILLFLTVMVILSGCRHSTRQAINDELIIGKVIKVLDGDTYDLLLEGNRKIRVRMEGIDAPEGGMPYYKKATKYLGELCQGQTIKVEKTGIDQYGRTLGFSYLNDGRELSREMLKAGYAWHYKQYNTDSKFAALENEARRAKRGLWQDANPIAPWEIRKLRRQGISTKKMFRIDKSNE